MSIGDRKHLDSPAIHAGQYSPDALQAGLVPAAALRSCYARLATKDRFLAQWWRPVNSHQAVSDKFVPEWDGDISSGVVWESELYLKEVFDRLRAHVVFATMSTTNIELSHTLRVDASAGEPWSESLDDMAPLYEGSWGSGTYDNRIQVGNLAIEAKTYECDVAVDIPGASLDTVADIELLLESTKPDGTGPGIGAFNYALLGFTLWGEIGEP